MEITGEFPVIEGNKLLMKVLFMNLLKNAFRESDAVLIKENSGQIWIVNGGKIIPPQLLKKLNQGSYLRQNEVSGMGKGVQLCHEIMHYHNGKLSYNSTKDSGNIAILFFNV